MKIMMISCNVASTPYSVYPLGMGMVANALLQAGHEVVQYDYLYSDMSIPGLEEKIDKFRPDLFGISIRNIDNHVMLQEKWYIDAAKDIVQAIRRKSDSRVVLGGSGYSIMPETILQEVGADYGICGEGEEKMLELVSAIENSNPPAQRCLYASNTLSGSRIPSAKYDDELMQFYLKNGTIATIQTKRGCPHKCVYCAYPSIEGKVYRPRDPGHIVDDIEHLLQYHGAEYIFFTDSVFNDDEGHFMDVVREMDKRDISTPWTAFFKPSNLSAEQIELMKKTGLVGVELGADAATDRTLKKMGKSFSMQEVKKYNELFNYYNVATAHYFMFGGPGETRETVEEGIENILNMTDTVSFINMGIRIAPNTAMEQIAIREGVISEEENLLHPKYYISPEVDPEWLEQRLTRAFTGISNCVFPIDSLDSTLQFLHRLGYKGSLWEMLIPDENKQKKRKRRQRNA
ncbi:MAG: lipid biosynthesis B12-binding/radical SAM protein [Thermodesulfobacteriota bacterium]